MATEQQAWPPCQVALSLPQRSLLASWGLCFRVSEVSVLDRSVSTGPSHSGLDANILIDQLTLETFRKPFFVIPEKSAFLSKASRMPIFGSTVSRS